MAASRSDKQKMARIYDRLGRVYGRRRRTRSGTFLDQLIVTILSSEAPESHAYKAYELLQKLYVDWNEVRVSDEFCLAEELKSAGVNSGAHLLLKSTLEGLLIEKSNLSPEVLDDSTPEQVASLLHKLSFPKSLAASLLLLLAQNGSDAALQVPLDEGVARFMARAGFASTPRATLQIHECLKSALPQGEEHNFHRVVGRLSREYCFESSPKCMKCPLRGDCRYLREKPGASGGAKAPSNKMVSRYRQTGAARRSRPPSPTARKAEVGRSKAGRARRRP